MGFIGDLWNNLLYIPLINIMVGLYEIIPLKNLALTILIFTVLTRLFLYPLSRKSKEYREVMSKLQPEMEKVKKKYEKDKEKMYQETMKLYGKYKANPMSGCLPLLIQLPFTLALYQVLREGLNPEHIDKINAALYSFMPKIQSFDTKFLWMDLIQPDPYYIIPVLVAGLQFVQTRISAATMSGAGSETAKQTMIYMPLIFLFITLRLPVGLTYYIFLTTLFGIIEMYGLSTLREVFKPSKSKEENSVAKSTQ